MDDDLFVLNEMLSRNDCWWFFSSCGSTDYENNRMVVNDKNLEKESLFISFSVFK